jgi:hypothetical protein
MTSDWAALLILLAVGNAEAAPAVLRDEAQLGALLQKSPQCCVIDARSAESRSAQPLPASLPYQRGLQINPTSAVVVVADSDGKALDAAKLVARTSPYPVYAVKGGVAAWKQVEATLAKSARAPGSPFDFVIPSDTCQQGPALQQFKADPGRPAPNKPK